MRQQTWVELRFGDVETCRVHSYLLGSSVGILHVENWVVVGLLLQLLKVDVELRVD